MKVKGAALGAGCVNQRQWHPMAADSKATCSARGSLLRQSFPDIFPFLKVHRNNWSLRFMIRRTSQAWRRLNAETIGTAEYWWIGLENAAFFQDMQPLISRYAHGRLLDIGAGRLAWKTLLQERTTSYLSGDVTRDHRGLDLVCDVSRLLPFADASFDTLFCCSVLEHTPEPWHAFAEMWRILAPNGLAIVSLPFLLHVHDEPHDYYRFTRYGFEYLAGKAGFEIVEMVASGGFFHLMLNVPSVVMSVAWEMAGLLSGIEPTTRIWLAVARAMDGLFGTKERFASNHIAVLRKTRVASGVPETYDR
jgi:SAM-dependent methyltransferase